MEISHSKKLKHRLSSLSLVFSRKKVEFQEQPKTGGLQSVGRNVQWRLRTIPTEEIAGKYAEREKEMLERRRYVGRVGRSEVLDLWEINGRQRNKS